MQTPGPPPPPSPCPPYFIATILATVRLTVNFLVFVPRCPLCQASIGPVRSDHSVGEWVNGPASHRTDSLNIISIFICPLYIPIPSPIIALTHILYYRPTIDHLISPALWCHLSPVHLSPNIALHCGSANIALYCAP